MWRPALGDCGLVMMIKCYAAPTTITTTYYYYYYYYYYYLKNCKDKYSCFVRSVYMAVCVMCQAT